MKKIIKSITVGLVIIGILISPAFAVSFPDVRSNFKFSEEIDFVSNLGLMIGDTQGKFNPNKTVSRAEMATIICNMLGEKNILSKNGSVFNDVPASHWANAYVVKAAALGIVTGYGNKKFGPDDMVTYEQAVTMFVSAVLDRQEALDSGGYPNGFILVAKNNHLLAGIAVNRGKAITRAEIAKIIYNYYIQPSEDDDISYLVIDAYRANLNGNDTAIPLINIGGATVEKINAEIFSSQWESVSYYNDYGGGAPCDIAKYDWAVNGDILSLVVWHHNTYPHYLVYNVSISSGELISDDQVVSFAGFTQAQYREKARQAVGSCFWKGINRDEIAALSQSDIDQFNKGLQNTITLSDEDMELAQPFLDCNGNLNIIGYIDNIDGDLVPLNLNDFELVPNFDKPVERTIPTPTITKEQAYSMACDYWNYEPKTYVEPAELEAYVVPVGLVEDSEGTRYYAFWQRMWVYNTYYYPQTIDLLYINVMTGELTSTIIGENQICSWDEL